MNKFVRFAVTPTLTVAKIIIKMKEMNSAEKSTKRNLTLMISSINKQQQDNSCTSVRPKVKNHKMEKWQTRRKRKERIISTQLELSCGFKLSEPQCFHQSKISCHRRMKGILMTLLPLTNTCVFTHTHAHYTSASAVM